MKSASEEIETSDSLHQDEDRTCHRDWRHQHVLVTGGNGFIGSHLTERLVALGANVTVVDRGDPHESKNLAGVAEKVEYVRQELSEADHRSLLAMHPFRAIFHFAGSATVPGSVAEPWTDFEMNLKVTLRLMESLREAKESPALILASSAAVYGDALTVPISEDTTTAPISPYGVSKLAMDGYASVYARLYGLRIGVIRPFAVFGPRLRKQVIYDFMRKLTADPEKLEAHGDGTQVRDFCYVADVVDAALMVQHAGKLKGEVYNVGSGVGSSIREVLSCIAERLEVQPEICWSGSVRPGEPEKWIADVRRLGSLGWRPRVTLQDGLNQTVGWFKQDQPAR